MTKEELLFVEIYMNNNNDYLYCDHCNELYFIDDLIEIESPNNIDKQLLDYFKQKKYKNVCLSCIDLINVDFCCCCNNLFEEFELSYYKDVMDYSHISVCEHMREYSQDSCICAYCEDKIVSRYTAIKIFYDENDDHFRIYKVEQSPISVEFLGIAKKDNNISNENVILNFCYNKNLISKDVYDKFNGDYFNIIQNENIIFIQKIVN